MLLPHAFMQVTFALLLRPSTAPRATCPQTRNQLQQLPVRAAASSPLASSAGCGSAWRVGTNISIAQVVGYIKGKSAIHIARTFAGRVRDFTGENFWARGYFASTVGRDEEIIRTYIHQQEEEDHRVLRVMVIEHLDPGQGHQSINAFLRRAG